MIASISCCLFEGCFAATARFSRDHRFSMAGRHQICGEPVTVTGKLQVRLHADLITCYKIINNLVAVPFHSFFKFAVSINTRGHPLKLMLPDTRVNARAHAFPVRVITVWNRLPTHVVLASSLLSFKNSLKTVDLIYTLFGKI